MILSSKWKFLLLVLPLLLFWLLWNRSELRPQLLPGLGGTVTAIAFSPNGKTLVGASSNNYVQTWVPDINKWRSFKGRTRYIMNSFCTRLIFSSDGKTLYTGGSAPNTFSTPFANAWDVRTRYHKFSFASIPSPVFDVSPDSHWAVLGHNDYVILVNLKGKPTLPPNNYRSRYDARLFPYRRIQTSANVTCVAFSPDSKTLIVGDERFQWQSAFWDVQSARQVPITTSIATSGVPSSLKWSPDGKRIAAVGAGKIAVYDVATSGVIEAPLPSGNTSSVPTMSPSSVFTSLDWSPDGQWLFSGGEEVRQWRSKDLKLWHSYGVSGPVAVAPDGQTIATANSPSSSGAKGVWLWKIR